MGLTLDNIFALAMCFQKQMSYTLFLLFYLLKYSDDSYANW